MKPNDVLTFPTGAEIDYRTEEQKNKDWRPEEAFASASPVEWRSKTIEEIEIAIKATSISQGYTSRCVSEYAGIALEYAERAETGQRIVFSRRDVYCRRSNRPQEGMGMADLFKIMREGTCLEEQLPSTDTLESEINKPYTVTDEMVRARSMYASGSSFTWTTFTIDDIAQRIQAGTPVCLFWYFDNTYTNEWWKEKPAVNNPAVQLFDQQTGRHQATAVNFCLIDGKKHLVVMDSAGQGTGAGVQKNIRFVSEDFFNARCYGAGFTVDKRNLDYKPQPFTYYFSKNLKFGDVHEDVKALQKILVLEGCLSLETPTENYFGMTRAGVKKLQEKYAKQILAPVGLKVGTGYFGSSTRAFINAKYNN